MPGIGFRLQRQNGAGQPSGLNIVYFTKTALGRDIESHDLPTVLASLAFDELREHVRLAFEELQHQISLSFHNGLEATNLTFEIEFDLFKGWKIHVDGLSPQGRLTFSSVTKFDQYMVEGYGIEALRPMSQADVLASTTPGL